MNKKVLYIFITIGILLLAVGGTYAMLLFASNQALSGKSIKFTVTLTSGENVVATDLIPSLESVVNDSYAKSGNDKCKDSYGMQVCSVYTFTVSNESPVSIIFNGSLISSINGFTNLKYKVYKTSGSVVGSISSTMTSIPTAGGNSILFQNESLETLSSATYDVVIWLNETSSNQLSEMDKVFEGYVKIISSAGIEAVYN